MGRRAEPWYWRARDCWAVKLDGRRVILAKGKANRPAADADFHRLMAARGEVVPLTKLSAGDVFDAFLEEVSGRVERGEGAQSTYDGYVRHLSSADGAFGVTRADALAPHDVHRWAHDRARRWGPTTRAGAVTAVKAAFRWAHRQGLLKTNPIAHLEKPTARRRLDVLSPDQARAVLAAADGPFRLFLTCLWLTGCRPGELATLEASGVDAAAGVLRVRDKIRKTTGKDTREVHATAAALAIVVPLAEARPEGGPIFRNAKGNPWTRNAMACAMRRIRAKTGLGKEATAYSFRHLWITDALAAGVSVIVAAELAGHRSTNMIASRYSHLAERRKLLGEAAAKVRPEGSGGVDAPE